MSGPRTPLADQLILTDAERHELTHRCRCTTIAAGQRDRAAIILLLADGQSVSATARGVGVGRRIARKWGERFVTARLAGLTESITMLTEILSQESLTSQMSAMSVHRNHSCLIGPDRFVSPHPYPSFRAKPRNLPERSGGVVPSD